MATTMKEFMSCLQAMSDAELVNFFGERLDWNDAQLDVIRNEFRRRSVPFPKRQKQVPNAQTT